LQQETDRERDKIVRRTQILEIFVSCLASKRFSVRMLFEQILGFKDIDEARISREQLQQFFDIVEA